MKYKNILIIGKVPPPIGGVTIHVSRLIALMKKEQLSFTHVGLSYINLLTLPYNIWKHHIIHLHSSNLKLQKIVCFICLIFRKTCIITFHGDLNRYNSKSLKTLEYVIKNTDIPIVLNTGSYEISKKLNSRSKLMSAFIPPSNEPALSSLIHNNIQHLKQNYQRVFATNAFAITYDKFNSEIYGILDLLQYFKDKTDIALIVSDPSGQYGEYIKQKNINFGSNIFIISEPHSYFEVLKLVDSSIRNTSTDGDSLSVKESLYLGKLTYATDVVARPVGTIVYERGTYDFYKFDLSSVIKDIHDLSGSKAILKLYKELADTFN